MSTPVLAASGAATSSLAGKYLTFTLRGESYGIPVLRVREIIRLTAITSVPQIPGHVRGVINLRGKIIPVIDLRVRFGQPAAEETDHTCIVVVHVHLADVRSAQMGLIVDDVEEVAHIGAAEIEEPPDFGGALRCDYIVGMAKLKGVVKSLLDIDRVIAGADPTLPAPARN